MAMDLNGEREAQAERLGLLEDVLGPRTTYDTN
jgi:hypothetical protein